MLNLVPYFEGRHIRDPANWEQQVLPELREFSMDAARKSDRLRLVLDAHVSLAFAVGALLNVKSGKRLEIEQRTGGRSFWSLDDFRPDPSWPTLVFEEEIVDRTREEIVVAVGLTHPVSPAVSAFVRQELTQVGRILHCVPETGPSQQSLSCGRHASTLGETIVRRLQSAQTKRNRILPVHLFIAGPNGFSFFFGQHQRAIGPTDIYEWDFEGQQDGGYSRSLRIG